MRITKAKLQVKSMKPFREQCLEGEAEGRLGKEFRLEVKGIGIAKLKGLFSNAASYDVCLGNLYDEAGELVTLDKGRFPINCIGKACMATVLYGLVDTTEFEECTFDCITILPEKGKVAELRARFRCYPTAKQKAKLDDWLKNEITLTLNGDTVMAGVDDEDAQAELGIGGPADEEDETSQEADEPPRAGKGELLPGVPDPKAEVPAAHRDSVEDLRKAGVLAGPKGDVKPSLAHGEVSVPGQKPAQRPRRRPSDTLQ